LRYWKNGIVRNQDAITQLNDLLLEEYQLLNMPGKKSFEWQQLHLHFQSTYFLMTGNPEGSLPVFYELDSLFQKNESLWHDDPLFYYQLLDGILNDLRWMERFDEMTFFIDRMKAISSSSESLNLLLKYGVMEHELNRLIDKSKFFEAADFLKINYKIAGREASQLPIHRYGQLMFAFARVWMNAGNYSEALKIINAMLNRPVKSTNYPLHIIFELLNLMVSALMNNRDYLHYALRSIERKLKSERKLFGTELLIISLLKRWINNHPFQGIEEQLTALSENPFEHQLTKDLCLYEWLFRMKIVKKKMEAPTQRSLMYN
jgi:hypothetical protein